ncbi:MAG TPA: copper chaperone PCu(A)C [Steroidobacteraceae bacterium]|nr:copper chaperone PCu(A)C [Steroidobacteraceae bacterium]
MLVVARASAQPPPLTAQDAWIRATPGSDVAAAYLTLHNAAAQPVTVIGVRTPAAAQAMIHETTITNGQSIMRAHEPLRIAGGATVRLAPGGLHIMLHALTRPLTPGDAVPLVLLLGGGGTLEVTARVRPLGDG